MTTTTVTAPALAVGERVRFARPSDESTWWWDVRATDTRFTVLTRQRPFRVKGELLYTIIDRERGVRGPCNLIGQGWDIEEPGGCERLLDALRRHADNAPGLRVEVSHRNNLPFEILETHTPAGPARTITPSGLPGPALPALNAEEFAPLGTFRGIDLQEDLDDAAVWALGHHDPARFAAAVTDYDVDLTRDPLIQPLQVDEVEHTHAVVLHRIASRDPGWVVTWAPRHQITGTTPGAFPITLIHR